MSNNVIENNNNSIKYSKANTLQLKKIRIKSNIKTKYQWIKLKQN
jgi:hypothetical protein